MNREIFRKEQGNLILIKEILQERLILGKYSIKRNKLITIKPYILYLVNLKTLTVKLGERSFIGIRISSSLLT